MKTKPKMICVILALISAIILSRWSLKFANFDLIVTMFLPYLAMFLLIYSGIYGIIKNINRKKYALAIITGIDGILVFVSLVILKSNNVSGGIKEIAYIICIITFILLWVMIPIWMISDQKQD